MSWDPTLEDIGKSVESGTKKALDIYADMTGNSAWYVPEFFVQSHIALALKDKCYVSLEELPRDLRIARGKPGPQPKDKSRRYDLVIWWEEDEKGARIAVELKRARQDSTCDDDIEKLQRAIEKGWVDRGMIVAYAINKNPKTIEERFEGIYNNIKKNSGKKIKAVEPHYKKPKKLEGDDYYWSVAWFEMRDASSEAIQSIRVRG